MSGEQITAHFTYQKSLVLGDEFAIMLAGLQAIAQSQPKTFKQIEALSNHAKALQEGDEFEILISSLEVYACFF